MIHSSTTLDTARPPIQQQMAEPLRPSTPEPRLRPSLIPRHVDAINSPPRMIHTIGIARNGHRRVRPHPRRATPSSSALSSSSSSSLSRRARLDSEDDRGGSSMRTRRRSGRSRSPLQFRPRSRLDSWGDSGDDDERRRRPRTIIVRRNLMDQQQSEGHTGRQATGTSQHGAETRETPVQPQATTPATVTAAASRDQQAWPPLIRPSPVLRPVALYDVRHHQRHAIDTSATISHKHDDTRVQGMVWVPPSLSSSTASSTTSSTTSSASSSECKPVFFDIKAPMALDRRGAFTANSTCRVSAGRVHDQDEDTVQGDMARLSLTTAQHSNKGNSSNSSSSNSSNSNNSNNSKTKTGLVTVDSGESDCGTDAATKACCKPLANDNNSDEAGTRSFEGKLMADDGVDGGDVIASARRSLHALQQQQRQKRAGNKPTLQFRPLSRTASHSP
ncbi:hypothetical protein PTSG_05967 [Salpingoeca rosetta]|uniref:Uncharacterized protein n=1 Tax=Salpingoeca rosetta (strain ATCC 50818 / BSB-021) TaxID=946362 RepID=F2UDA9_SALR5|nr:uncharacterized protein PTSG_05967 [Salpingoeca rosetta]EGD74604.1 hypothetical protein PTSG_05967 [Salpingoeca rosetta]|eukprot:XP_004992861.1 hypothetical protein PTSG_05967 [Salpingoeca rosetta]